MGWCSKSLSLWLTLRQLLENVWWLLDLAKRTQHHRIAPSLSEEEEEEEADGFDGVTFQGSFRFSLSLCFSRTALRPLFLEFLDVSHFGCYSGVGCKTFLYGCSGCPRCRRHRRRCCWRADNIGFVVRGSPAHSGQDGIRLHCHGSFSLRWLSARVSNSVAISAVLWVRKLELGSWFLQTADIDEKAIRKEKPEELVTALAEAKVMVFSSRENLVLFVFSSCALALFVCWKHFMRSAFYAVGAR